MTAANIIVAPDAVALIADTASTDNGVVAGLASKITVNETHRWGVVGNGSLATTRLLLGALPDIDFDALCAILPMYMRAAHEPVAAQLGNLAGFGIALGV